MKLTWKPTKSNTLPKRGLRKVRKSPRATLVRKLDKIVSEITRAREPQCVVCGTTDRLTNGHLFSRVAYSARWDINIDGNCHTQCIGCNMRHEYDSYPYTNWYLGKFGQQRYDELHRRYTTPRKFSTNDLETMHEALKTYWEDIKG